MKKMVVMIFVLIFLYAINYGYSQQPFEPAPPGSKERETGQKLSPGPGLKEPGPGPLLPSSEKKSETEQPGEIYFAAGATSPDGQYLYVIFDRFLLQYTSQTLDLKKKVDLGIPVAPVTPSITVSKDSRNIYVVSNGILFQINAEKFKIEKVKKITF